MDEHGVAGPMGAWQSRQEGPSRLVLTRFPFDLFPGPENGPFGSAAESFGIKQSAVVVIAQQAKFKLATQIDAGTGIRTITDHITQTKNAVNILFTDVVQHGAERFRITMNVTDDGVAAQLNIWGWGRVQNEGHRVNYREKADHLTYCPDPERHRSFVR